MIKNIYFYVTPDGKPTIVINDDNGTRIAYAIGDKINGARIVHFAFINNTVIIACDDGNDYCYDDHFEYEKANALEEKKS